MVWSASYNSFGQVHLDTNNGVVNNLRFAGQYYDSETGLHYNWHRYYDPEMGRYLRTDPLGLDGGVNLYAFVSNNPLIYSDPDGLIARNVWNTSVDYWSGQYESATDFVSRINVDTKQLASSSLGMTTSSLGIIAGFGSALIPEPTMATKVLGTIVVGKSSADFTLNAQNFVDSFRLDNKNTNYLPSTAATYAAALIAPGNTNVSRAFTAGDIAIDLMFGLSVKSSLAHSINKPAGPPGTVAGSVERVHASKPIDQGTWGDIFVGTSLSETFYKNVLSDQ